MSIENEIQDLTQSTTDLLNAVNTKKVTLDNAVSQAQTAVTDATSQVALAAAEKVGAQTARDEAETHKNQAYTYSQSAASAVAYQDLTAIAQTKAESAVDVFVYDTSKDSDGGAWRHRTQHTSWYNETLNTSTRGSRKEFPAVAVIVAEAGKVTIYDGDDPTLPMWMVFNQGGNTASNINHLSTLGADIKALSSLNGIICPCGEGGYMRFDFIKDVSTRTNASNTSLKIGGISERNNGRGQIVESSIAIVNGLVNDVAMTVLPDAPIDQATGLPIPTIAVATDGGVSVIKDDGTVVDATFVNFGVCNNITFIDDIVYFSNDYSSGAHRFSHTFRIPSSDINLAVGYEGNDNPYEVFSLTGDAAGYNHDVSFGGASNAYLQDIEGTNIASSQGYIPFTYGESGVELFAKIASTYNTGWMNGDIKLATLSDTDDTDLVGSELVTNGTFDTDTSGWISAQGASLTVSNNRLRTTSTTTDYAKAYQDITVEIGKTYVITADVYWVSGSVAWIGIGNNVSAENINLTNVNSSNSEKSVYVTYTATTNLIRIKAQTHNANVGDAVEIDNISVRLAEPDRSVNNNGLQVVGTVQKNPVATGADLVGYSGFGPSDYLQQPYNSDLDFGAGDFCGMWWVKTADHYYTTLDRRYGESGFSSTGNFFIGTTAKGSTSCVRLLLSSGVFDSVEIPQLVSNTWTNICIVRVGDVIYFYVNGELKDSLSGASPYNISSPNEAYSVVGVRGDGNQNLTGSLALLRISGTAPTAEQIKKIYEDEKVLFQENAKATLHGTSDAVTALAYDEDTEILSVGTSSGRSDFRGLRRVNNTTDAVGVAISASNGLIVEE